MTLEQRERAFAFGLITIILLAVLWRFLDYVPVWDGRIYANCVISAAAEGLSFDTLRCAGHPTQGWALLLALPQIFRLGSVTVLHLTDVALGLLALASIRVILGRVFPARELAWELDLATLACAVHPVVLSTLLQVNIDFGVYVFFFAALAALLSGELWWTIVAGIFLCFSKETGVLAYALIIGLDALFRFAEGKAALGERFRRLVPCLILLAPLVLFVAHVTWWDATHAKPAVWKQTWQKSTFDGFRFFDLSEPIFVSYATGIFVLGFGWVVSAIIAGDLAVAGVRMVRRLGDRPVPGADRRQLVYITVLTVVLTYLLTAFRTWSNLRYFALLYPLLLFLAYAALLRLGAGRWLRVATLGVVTLLFGFAAFRSSDPLSRLAYGTFSIGDGEMYRMASITGEYDGPGRDELVYNLQFTGFHYVQDAFFAQIHPTDSTAIATSRPVRWNIWSQLDSTTLRRTMAREHVVVPRYSDEVDLAAMPNRPREAWFLVFSNRPKNDRALESLRTLYRDDAVLRVHFRGHVLVAHHLVRREPPVLP